MTAIIATAPPMRPQAREPHPHFETLANLSAYWIEYQPDAALLDALAAVSRAEFARPTLNEFARSLHYYETCTDRYTRPVETIDGMAHRIDNATSAFVVAVSDLFGMRDRSWSSWPSASPEASSIVAVLDDLTRAVAAHLAPACRVAVAYLPGDRLDAEARSAEHLISTVAGMFAKARTAVRPIEEERARWTAGGVGAVDIALHVYSLALGIACGLILEPEQRSTAPDDVRERARKSVAARQEANRKLMGWSTWRTGVRLQATPTRELLAWVRGIGGTVSESLRMQLDRPKLVVEQLDA